MTQFTITRTRLAVAAFVVSIVGPVCEVHGQEFKIGIIDLYGLSRVSAGQVREALLFREGDTILRFENERPAMVTASEDRLARLPGIARARINVVCCDQGLVIVFVGVEERGTTTMPLRTAPLGTARLAADIVQSGEEFSKAVRMAVERGDAAEDRSKGHSFSHDPATRTIQERFVVYAKRDLAQLRLVLPPNHRVPFQSPSSFLAQVSIPMWEWAQHLLRLKLRGAKRESRRDARGLETHSGPHTGLLKRATSHARVRCRQARGRGSPSGERVGVAGERAGVPSTRLAAGPLAPDHRLVALCGARVVTIGDELGPDWLELDNWLARPLLRYAARNLSIENTVPRDSM